MKRAALTLALGTGLLAAVLGTAAAADQRAQDPYEMQSPFAIQVAGDRTLVTRLPAAADASAAPALLIPLPPDATTWSVNLTAGGGSVSGDGRLPRLRGLPVAVVNTAGLGEGARFEVVHDGDWSSAVDDRLRSPGFDAALGAGGSLPADAAGKSLAPSRGTYVVITTPAYAPPPHPCWTGSAPRAWMSAWRPPRRPAPPTSRCATGCARRTRPGTRRPSTCSSWATSATCPPGASART
ncbi:MAG: hypothetical protein IPI34_09765 [bacterium]|nr:hypothetical protein [bacterium]